MALFSSSIAVFTLSMINWILLSTTSETCFGSSLIFDSWILAGKSSTFLATCSMEFVASFSPNIVQNFLYVADPCHALHPLIE
ncbi:hypothetical protein AURDEDRAFT_171296 [Auricularia subglabra TFB-10046 SS5]|nr:hypothetical protein AURDEDRAFT_171296 [Auricularia subglabra TFB-10046 SS5]